MKRGIMMGLLRIEHFCILRAYLGAWNRINITIIIFQFFISITS